MEPPTSSRLLRTSPVASHAVTANTGDTTCACLHVVRRHQSTTGLGQPLAMALQDLPMGKPLQAECSEQGPQEGGWLHI